MSLASSLTGITNFEVLGQLHPPFRLNLAGIMIEVGDPQPTSNGSGKQIRSVVISDLKGYQVTVKQLGSPVDDGEIEPGHHVLLYFVSGSQTRRPGEAGSLWAFEDSYFKMGPQAESIPPKAKDIAIQGE